MQQAAFLPLQGYIRREPGRIPACKVCCKGAVVPKSRVFPKGKLQRIRTESGGQNGKSSKEAGE